MTSAADRHLRRDIDLLRIELGVIWRLDERGRLPGPEDVVIGVTSGGVTGAVSCDVPDTLADRLLHLIAQAEPTPSIDQPPQALAECRTLLGGERITLSGGPTYLIEPPLHFAIPAEPPRRSREEPHSAEEKPPARSHARPTPPTTQPEPPARLHAQVTPPAPPIEPPSPVPAEPRVLRSSDPADVRRIRAVGPPEVWQPDEWADLVGGREGAPWAMIVEHDQVVAICHTPRLTPTGAEAGTWTSPAHRGRGYAAATTAAWAGLLPGDIHLFYSTSADNHSSQGVAARLGLRPLGWFWKLTA